MPAEDTLVAAVVSDLHTHLIRSARLAKLGRRVVQAHPVQPRGRLLVGHPPPPGEAQGGEVAAVPDCQAAPTVQMYLLAIPSALPAR